MNWSQSEVDAVYARRKAEAEGYVNLLPDKPAKRGMNKLESSYSQHLDHLKLIGEGVVQWYAFEWFKLRLADGAWFRPDFAVFTAGGHLEFHEVKGFWREAARVRIRVAADRYPFRFVAVTKDKRGEWVYEQF